MKHIKMQRKSTSNSVREKNLQGGDTKYTKKKNGLCSVYYSVNFKFMIQPTDNQIGYFLPKELSKKSY
jgi:hypothetical protein